MVEQWTRERRLERTRTLLLDAAEEVFAEKGFTPASLDDIARAAGYTKGAIYKHFATKEELFLAVSDRYWRRYFDNFAEVLSAATEVGSRELDDIAERWRRLSLDRGAEHAALGHEFTLYLLRNPDARERVAAKRSEVVEALANGSFTLLAQPIVPLKNRSLATSYELLVRMNAKDGSALAPDMFFSAATRYQLLPRLDRWVLNETMRQLQPYSALLSGWNTSFAINISGQSLGDSEFADFARATLKSSGIDPKWITLEITESAAIGNLEIAKRFISRMTALGCRFALDDFGTGLSSLAYLKELAVSSIKIDGVFVRDLLSSSRSEAMIEAVMTIANELKLDTVAEFVESQAICDRLIAFGVTHGQGYAFGRPQPLGTLLASLAAGRQPDQDLRKQTAS